MFLSMLLSLPSPRRRGSGAARKEFAFHQTLGPRLREDDGEESCMDMVACLRCTGSSFCNIVSFLEKLSNFHCAFWSVAAIMKQVVGGLFSRFPGCATSEMEYQSPACRAQAGFVLDRIPFVRRSGRGKATVKLKDCVFLFKNSILT